VSTLLAELAERIEAIATDLEGDSTQSDPAAQVSYARSNIQSAQALIDRGHAPSVP
jgi:hypothetical protein